MNEELALMNGFERPCCRCAVGMNLYLNEAELDFFHAATEHDAAPMDNHQVGNDVLDLFDLMRRHNNGAAAVKVVIQQRIVKLLAKRYVQSQCRLVEHQQPGVDRHDHGEV